MTSSYKQIKGRQMDLGGGRWTLIVHVPVHSFDPPAFLVELAEPRYVTAGPVRCFVRGAWVGTALRPESLRPVERGRVGKTPWPAWRPCSRSPQSHPRIVSPVCAVWGGTAKRGQAGSIGSWAVNTVTDGITVETLGAKYVRPCSEPFQS